MQHSESTTLDLSAAMAEQAEHCAASSEGSRSVGMQPLGHRRASTTLFSCTSEPRTPTSLRDVRCKGFAQPHFPAHMPAEVLA